MNPPVIRKTPAQTVDVRGGETGHNVRYVLAFSLLGEQAGQQSLRGHGPALFPMRTGRKCSGTGKNILVRNHSLQWTFPEWAIKSLKENVMLKSIVIGTVLSLACAAPAFAAMSCSDAAQRTTMEQSIKAMPEGPNKVAALKAWDESSEAMKANKMDDCNSKMDEAQKKIEEKS